jgi:sugar phosphate permease
LLLLGRRSILLAATSTPSLGRRVYYGWYLLAASWIAMAFGSGFSFWSFGLYVSPLEAEFGWSRAEVSLGFSAALLVSGVASPFVGRLIDQRGPRSSILIGATLCSLSFILLAFTSSLWQWYVFNIINAVFRQMMFFIPFQALVSRWFDARRGVALSILGTGFSMGGFLVVPLMRYVIDTIDWEGAFIFSSVMTALIFLPAGLFVVRNSPGDVGQQIDGGYVSSKTRERPKPRASIDLPHALRTPIFWLMAFGLCFLFFGMFGWTVHQVPFWEERGYSRETGALFVSAAAGVGILLRLSLGVVADRIPRFEYAGMAFTASLALSMLTLLLTENDLGVVVYLAFWIFGSSGGPMIEALLLTRAFGVAHFATILGTVVVVETLGQIISPTVAGAIFDSTASYDLALVMFICTFSASFVLFAIASRLPRPIDQLEVQS